MAADQNGIKASYTRNDPLSKETIQSPTTQRDPYSKDIIDAGVSTRGAMIEKSPSDEAAESAICQAAEPKGMNTYKLCSADCKTVCSVKKRVGEVNCFTCQQGGDDTCADIGALEADADWCQPGGVCYEDGMLYCTPFDGVGPRRSKLKCTNCKKRPDMCWQKVKDGTMTYTNCLTGCWNGTCEYRGKYTEKEWDGKDDFIHCYECVTPPPPPSCEDLKWGYDWKAGCLNNCNDPNYCEEFQMTKGGPNKCCDQKAQADANASDKGKDKDKDKKTGVRSGGGGGAGGGGSGGGSGAKPPKGDINDPNVPFGPGETATKPKDPCQEVADSLKGSDYVENQIPEELENQKENLERLNESVAKLKEKASKVESFLKPMRENVQSLAQQLSAAQAELKTAQTEAKGAENLGGYGKQKLDALKKAQTKASDLTSHYAQAKSGLERQAASFDKDIAALKNQAQKDLYRADPNAKTAEAMGRTDMLNTEYHDLSRLQQRREISDRIFNEEAKELQKKIDQGGDKAQDYQRQLDNLNRGKNDVDQKMDSRERAIKQAINDQQKKNAEDGVGPFDEKTLWEGVGEAGMEMNRQRNKIKNVRDTLAKAAKNNCPPKGADKAVEELDKRLKEIDAMLDSFERQQQEIDDGYPLSQEDKKNIEISARRAVETSKKDEGVKSMASFYLESQAEEIARTFDPTDPRVGLKKAFWYGVGIAEGVGKSIKGLIELGVGTLDLIGETAAKYAGFEDGGIFGTDASAALQKVLGGLDGNMNLDGLEKLGQGIDKAISTYLKKLSRAKDLDKALPRAGGQFAGELIVGDAVVAGVLGKAGTILRGADEAADAAKVINKAAEVVPPGPSAAGKIAGKIDDIPPIVPKTPGSKTTDIAEVMNQLDREMGVTPKAPLEPRVASPITGPVKGGGPRPGPGPDIMGDINKTPLDDAATKTDAAEVMNQLDREMGVTPKAALEPRTGTSPIKGPVNGGGPRPGPGPDIMGDINKTPLDEAAPATGVNAGASTPRAPPKMVDPNTPPKVSTHAKENAELNFVDEGGRQIELETGKHLGSGSTSTVYADAANPNQVIRVTDMAGDVKDAVQLDKVGRGIITDVSKQTDSIRVVEQYDQYVVKNTPGSRLNNKVVEIGENMKQGMAKDMIAKQGGKLTEQQAQALNRATKDLNDRGYAWLDAKPDNYTFEKIPGTDDLRVVVVDPGGIVPMKGLDPGKARAIQKRINQPSAEFIEGMNMTNNPMLKDLVSSDEWKSIIADHGNDIDINALDVAHPSDVKFNPSGNVNQPRVGELFGH